MLPWIHLDSNVSETTQLQDIAGQCVQHSLDAGLHRRSFPTCCFSTTWPISRPLKLSVIPCRPLGYLLFPPRTRGGGCTCVRTEFMRILVARSHLLAMEFMPHTKCPSPCVRESVPTGLAWDAQNRIIIGLEARLEDRDSWMGFGISDQSSGRTRMVGTDATFTGYHKVSAACP